MTEICQKLNENSIVMAVNNQFLQRPNPKNDSLKNYISQPKIEGHLEEEVEEEDQCLVRRSSIKRVNISIEFGMSLSNILQVGISILLQATSIAIC